MLTYALTTRADSDSDPAARDIDCHYFTSDIHFTYFKDGANKTVYAVPTDHVVAIELKQQHDGTGSKASYSLHLDPGNVRYTTGEKTA